MKTYVFSLIVCSTNWWHVATGGTWDESEDEGEVAGRRLDGTRATGVWSEGEGDRKVRRWKGEGVWSEGEGNGKVRQGRSTARWSTCADLAR